MKTQRFLYEARARSLSSGVPGFTMCSVRPTSALLPHAWRRNDQEICSGVGLFCPEQGEVPKSPQQGKHRHCERTLDGQKGHTLSPLFSQGAFQSWGTKTAAMTLAVDWGGGKAIGSPLKPSLS